MIGRKNARNRLNPEGKILSKERLQKRTKVLSFPVVCFKVPKEYIKEPKEFNVNGEIFIKYKIRSEAKKYFTAGLTVYDYREHSFVGDYAGLCELKLFRSSRKVNGKDYEFFYLTLNEPRNNHDYFEEIEAVVEEVDLIEEDGEEVIWEFWGKSYEGKWKKPSGEVSRWRFSIKETTN